MVVSIEFERPNLRAVSVLGNTAGTPGLISTGTFYLAGGNNITLSQDGQSITIIGGGGGGAGGVALGVSTDGNTLGDTGTQNTGTIVLEGGNNVTLSQVTGVGVPTTVIISGENTVAQSKQTQDLFDLQIAGNTIGAGTALVSSGTLTLVAGNNITLSQDLGNVITVLGPTQTAQPTSEFQAGVNNDGNTAGTTGSVSRSVEFVGGNNVTLSQSVNGQSATITINAQSQSVQPEGTQTLGMSNLGNTSGTTGVVTGTGIEYIFVGGNNITLSQSINGVSGTVTISGPNAGGAQTGISGISAGTAAATSGTISFKDTNGVSFGLDGQTLTASIAAQSLQPEGTQTLGMSNIGNTSGTTGVVTGTGIQFLFAGGNNITLSQSINGVSGTITISAANETQTVPPIGTAVKQVATALSTGTITRFAPEDHAHAGVGSLGLSNIGNTSGDTGTRQGQIVFAGGNNITLSQATGAGGVATITISAANETQVVPAIATAVKSVVSANSVGTITRFAGEDHAHAGVYSIGFSTMGNTVGDTAVRPGQLVLVGGNNITLSGATAAGSLQTITISAPNAPAVPDNIVNSIGISTNGNTGGTTGFGAGTNQRYVFVGSDNITLSQSVNGASATLSIIGATAASNPATLSYFAYPAGGLINSTPFSPASNTWQIAPFVLPAYLSMSYLRFIASWQLTSTSFATSAVPWSTTFSVAATYWAQIFSQNTGASSRSLVQVAAGSAGWTWQVSATGAGATNLWTLTHAITWPQEGNNTNSDSVSIVSTLSTVNVVTLQAFLNNFNGIRYLDIPFATLLTPGNYWLALNSFTTTGGGKGINMAGSALAITQPNVAMANLGSAANSTNQIEPGIGTFTTNVTGTTASIPMTNIRSVASQLFPFMQAFRQA